MRERDFGTSLKLVRIWLGISQEEMAEMLHHSRVTQNAYEAGRVEPGTRRLQEIAQILNIPADWLAGLGKTFPWEYKM